MRHILYKLTFSSPVHFAGDARGALEQVSMLCRSDTFFSALCTEAASSGLDVEELMIQPAAKGELLISDLLPWHREELYLPRPMLPPALPQAGFATMRLAAQGSAARKKMKKLQYLPVLQLEAYLAWVKGQGELPEYDNAFGAAEVGQRVNCRGAETLPYFVAGFSFQEEAGLYFVLALSDAVDAAKLTKLVESLGYTGIGGKRSSGFGKFRLAEAPVDMLDKGASPAAAALLGLLRDNGADQYMALSTLCPAAKDLSVVSQGRYALVPRGGFVGSAAYASSPVKRDSVHMVASGACFSSRVGGQVVCLGEEGSHKVYRMGQSLYAGLKL